MISKVRKLFMGNQEKSEVTKNHATIPGFKPYGITIKSAYKIKDSTDLILLLDERDASITGHRNIVRVNKNGRVIWEVEAPPKKIPPGPDRDNQDYYSDITQIDESTLKAFATYCYSDEINLVDGKIVKSIFTK